MGDVGSGIVEAAAKSIAIGALEYSIDILHRFAATDLPAQLMNLLRPVSAADIRSFLGGVVLQSSGELLPDFAHANGVLSCMSIALSPVEHARIFADAPCTLRFIALDRRNLRDKFVTGIPTRQTIVKWVRSQHELDVSSDCCDAPLATRSAGLSAADAALLELPRKRKAETLATPAGVRGLKRRLDPVKVVFGLCFSRHLKTPKLFTDAMQDSVADEHCLQLGETECEDRDASGDASRRSLERARAALDAVSMAMDRRELRSWQVADCLLGICLFSDASPVIGRELQGMVAEFLFKDGSMRRRTLPGLIMSHGHCDWVSKAMALVWAVFLIAGPTLDSMYFFFDNVRSVTTDYGVELSIVTICDVLPAFLKWRGGATLDFVGPFVSHAHRLMPRALRIWGVVPLAGKHNERYV